MKKLFALLFLLTCPFAWDGCHSTAELKPHFVRFEPLPNWVPSAEREQSRDPTILVVDIAFKAGSPPERTLVRYDSVGYGLYSTHVPPDPIWLYRNGKNNLRSANNCLVRSMEGSKVADLASLLGEDAGCWQLTDVGNNRYVVLGDIKDNGEWKSGASIVDTREGKWEWISVATDRSWRRAYILAGPWITAIGDTAYFLRLGTNPGLVKVSRDRKGRGLTTVIPLPEVARNPLPDIGELEGLKSFPIIYKKLADTDGAVGLYKGSNGKGVYLLTRRHEARTLYEVWRLDRRERKWNKIYETDFQGHTARHVTAVPGGKWWAFILKGEIQNPREGDMGIEGMYLVPSSDIE